MLAARNGRTMVGSGVLLVALAGTTATFAPGVASASSHREAPLIAGNPKADNTDTYAFVSADAPDSVNLIANWIPFEEPNGGPNFYPFAEHTHYNLNVDSDGDGAADIVYQWTFTNSYRHTNDTAQPFKDTFLYNTGQVKSLNDPNLNFQQKYTLTKVVPARAASTLADGSPGLPARAASTTTLLTDQLAAPSDTGVASMPDYGALRAEATVPLPNAGGMTYAGQADDSFFLDLRIFDLLYGGDLSETGHDTLAGYNVNTIALQVPKDAIALNGSATKNPVIGMWSTTDQQAADIQNGTVANDAKFVQVSRLGNPLVNEAVVPASLKDTFNTIPPSADHTAQKVVDFVTKPTVPALIEAIYGVPAPAEPRNDLVEIFLTGIAKKAPTLDGSTAPIQADLNSQILNSDYLANSFVPSEELRLNMAVAPTAQPSRLGVLANDFQGFPNGRRLADDVVDIEIQALEGAAQSGKLVDALASGDGVNTNDVPFGTTFPYVALPHTNSVNGAQQAAAPTSAAAASSSAPASASASASATKSTASGVAGTSTTVTGTPVGGVATGDGGLATSTTSSSMSRSTSTLALIAGAAGLGLVGAGAVTLRRSRRSATQS